MFQKDMRFAYLADFYGELLDEHTRAVIMAYYDDDLSLSEIAYGEGISRQGVRHIIKKGEEQLDSFEEKLGLAKKHEAISLIAERLSASSELLLSSDEDGIRKVGTDLRTIAMELIEK